MSPTPTSRSHSLIVRTLLALALALGGVSCMSPQPLDAAFIANKKQKVAVVTLAAPKATVHHIGGQGLLDMALNQAFSVKGRKRLEDYPSQARLDEVGTHFAKRLTETGYKADFIAGQHPEQKDFAPMVASPSASKPIPGRDSYLKGYDAALFISMPMVGQAELVYGFIPLSNRDGMALMHGAMFTTGDQKRLYRSPVGKVGPGKGCAVEGDKDNVDNIFKAVDKAVKFTSEDLEKDFFRGL